MKELTLEQKLHKDRESLLAFCAKCKRVRVFGSGDTAVLMHRYLIDEDIAVHDFIVPDADYTKDTFGTRPVLRFSEARFEEGDGLILAVEMWMQGLVLETILGREDAPEVYQQAVYGQYEGMAQDISLMREGYMGNDAPEGYFKAYTELNRLGLLSGTDKSDRVHNYLNKYEFFLNRWKDEPITLLELGIFRGESLLLWRDYFQKAQIIGVDINPQCARFAADRVRVEISDLSLAENLQALAAYSPSVIIDDASHIWSHQIRALCMLYPVLPHGGVYIMEDLETSFSAYRFGNYDDAPFSAYAFCAEIAEIVAGGEHMDPANKPHALALMRPELEAIAQDTEFVGFLKGSCILIKK